MLNKKLAQYSLKDGKIHRGGRVIKPSDLVEALNEKADLENECEKRRLSNDCLYEALEKSNEVTSVALEAYRCELRQEESAKVRSAWQSKMVWLECHTPFIGAGIVLIIVLYGAILRLLAS